MPTSFGRLVAALVRRSVPALIKTSVPVRWKACVRALLGVEPWPDWAVRHALFRGAEYRRLRRMATAFDRPRPHKPVLERPHQASYVVARWFRDAGVRRAFHVGYMDGRYCFYLSRLGIECAGTDLPPEETEWVKIPDDTFDVDTRRRLLRVDFFDLTADRFRTLWPAPPVIDVVFSEATFETMLPWRSHDVSVKKYRLMSAETRAAHMRERFPEKLAELGDVVRNFVFIEPEPDAGGAGAVFDACARRLPDFEYAVWSFRPPLDMLFRLSPRHPVKQTIYAYCRSPRLLTALDAYAVPLVR